MEPTTRPYLRLGWFMTNLRAAGGGELRIHGRPEAFRVREIEGQERVQVVGAYRQKLGRAVDRYFAEIPDPAAIRSSRSCPSSPRRPAS